MKIALVLFTAVLSVVLMTAEDGPVLQEPEEDFQVVKGIENNIFADDNEKCLVCHGEAYFELADTALGIARNRIMPDDYFIERDEFYQSNHWSFACIDCHSYDFEMFPHPVEARLEEPYNCSDCHGYDEMYAKYQFEKIEDEYMESTHAEIEGFSCWKCHDPHSYEVFIRNTTDFEQAILENNNMCLECHANYDNFQLLSDRKEIEIVQSHDWLPNQEAHFQNVRCLECHTEINDSILIAHKVLPMDKAVKRCTECHSADTRLMATLYKYQSQEFRGDVGFLNGVILNQSFVVGAHRNVILNYLSYIIFAGVILVLFIHMFFRVIKKS